MNNTQHSAGDDQLHEHEQANAARETTSNLVAFDLRTLARPRQDGPGVAVLSDVGAARVVLFTFQAGQQLKEHQTSSQILVQVVRGRITFATSEAAVDARAGTLLQLEAHVPHSVTALTNAVVLVTMVPSPSTHPQANDVLRGQTPLVERAP